jgi:hypothetical protein
MSNPTMALGTLIDGIALVAGLRLAAVLTAPSDRVDVATRAACVRTALGTAIVTAMGADLGPEAIRATVRIPRTRLEAPAYVLGVALAADGETLVAELLEG